MSHPYSGNELVLGTLRGFRQHVKRDGAFFSVNVDSQRPWSDGFNTSKCNTLGFFAFFAYLKRAERELHSSPSRKCGCGFYATYAPDVARAEPTVQHSAGEKWLTVVEAKGRIVLGTRGFRAEEMRIVDAIKPRDTAWGRRAMRSFLKRYPPDDVAHLLGSDES